MIVALARRKNISRSRNFDAILRNEFVDRLSAISKIRLVLRYIYLAAYLSIENPILNSYYETSCDYRHAGGSCALWWL